MAELVDRPIDVAALLAASARPDCGALTVFLGTTRNHNAGRRVIRLAYEAYRVMAMAALARIEAEAVSRHAIRSCRIVHRLGEVPPAEASVVVVVAAEHREAAFDACRWVIEVLKQDVPIWKKEHFSDGGAEWVEGTPL